MKTKKKPIYITGHKNPDTDAICSPLAYAALLKKLGEKAIACRLGKLNKETEFVLKYFQVKSPKLLKSAKGKKIILLDHNEFSQSPEGIEESEVLEVIDHHKIAFHWPRPIFFQTEPIGSTSTLIAKKYFQKKVKIEKKIAGLLLAGILSDTVIFRSSTTTKEDIKIGKKLARIAGIKNIEKWGLEMKKEKASLKGLKVKEIIHSDFKEYKIGRKKVGIGQVEICDEKELKEKKEEILKELERERKDYVFMILMATNILKGGTEIIFNGEKSVLEKAFKKKIKGNSFYLPGVMSRKKEVLPPLTKILSSES